MHVKMAAVAINSLIMKKKIKATPAEPEEMMRLKWWLNHSKKQIVTTWKLLDDVLDEATKISIFEALGRNCASNLDWAKRYKKDLEGFFEFMNKRAGETFDYDKNKGVITITTNERKCDCHLVEGVDMPPVYCNCSKGWQKYTYETILDNNVDVVVKESVLSGSKRCVFVVTILQ